MPTVRSSMSPVIIIEAPRRLDAAAAPAFGSFAVSLVEAGAHRVILDFSAVTYLGSVGLRALMSIRKALISHDGRLTLMACHPAVAEVLRICGLKNDLTLVESIEEARQSV